jgi:hypothetical protein
MIMMMLGRSAATATDEARPRNKIERRRRTRWNIFSVILGNEGGIGVIAGQVLIVPLLDHRFQIVQ